MGLLVDLPCGFRIYWYCNLAVLDQAQAINRVCSRADLAATFAGFSRVVDRCFATKDEGACLELWWRVGLVVELDLESDGQRQFLIALFLVDGIILLFALSLRRHRFVLINSCLEIEVSIRAQLAGFLLLCVVASMEFLFPWFNNEFVFVVPIVLLVEEVLVARQFTRPMGAPKRDLPGTATKIGQA